MSMPVEAPTRPVISEEQQAQKQREHAAAFAKQEEAIAKALSPFVQRAVIIKEATAADKSVLEMHQGDVLFDDDTDTSLDHLWIDYGHYIDPNTAREKEIRKLEAKQEKYTDWKENSVQIQYNEHQEPVYVIPYMPNLIPEEWPHASYELRESDEEIMEGDLRAILPRESHVRLNVKHVTERTYAVEMLDLKERAENRLRLTGHLLPFDEIDGNSQFIPNQEVYISPNAEAQTFRSLEQMHTVFRYGTIVHDHFPQE
jgi:hypothetical protein